MDLESLMNLKKFRDLKPHAGWYERKYTTKPTKKYPNAPQDSYLGKINIQRNIVILETGERLTSELAHRKYNARFL